MNRPVLSAVIIAFNEEGNIDRCISSLDGIADEVLVVDSGSTDRTVDLAEAAGARVLFHSFEGHIEQKNWAAGQAMGAWLISLDADEAIGPELRTSLLKWKEGDRDGEGYEFNRLTSYCGHWVRHGGWYPDRKCRLWRAGQAQWAGENPHDRLELNSGRSPHRLKGDLLHYSYHEIEDHIRQIRFFTDIAATEYRGPVWMTWGLIRPFKSAFQWVKNALLRGGWRDGWAGWTIAKWSAYATAEKYRKAAAWRRKKAALKRSGREEVHRLLVCRTDAIGDVVLTLPIAGRLADHFEVDVLVRAYAAPVARASQSVKRVLEWDGHEPLDLSVYDAAILAFPDVDVAKALKEAGVPLRLGTGRRWPFRRYINLRHGVSRKYSGQHEAWHGLDLAHVLQPVPGWIEPGAVPSTSPSDWAKWTGLQAEPWGEVQKRVEGAASWLIPGRSHVILHPGSNNSATNWSIHQYAELMRSLINDGHRVIWTGTAQEAAAWPELPSWCQEVDAVNATGALKLEELMSLIQEVDGLVASSTGPLHLASALGRACVGLYGTDAPTWPERWHPMGYRAAWIATSDRTQSGHLAIEVTEVSSALAELGVRTPAQ